MTDKTPSCNYN